MAKEIILKLGLNVGFCFVVGVSYSIFNLCKTFHLIWTVFLKKKMCPVYEKLSTNISSSTQNYDFHRSGIGNGVTSLYVSLSYPHVHRAIVPDT